MDLSTSSNNDSRVHVYVQPWDNLQTQNKRVLAIDHMITINGCILYTVQCTYTCIVYGFVWQFTNTYTINGYLLSIGVLTLEYGYFNSECVLTRSTDTCTYTEYRQLQAKYWFIRLYGYLYISSILHVVVIETIYGYFHITSVLIDIYGYLYYRRLFIDIRVLVLHWVLTIGG